MVIDFSSKGRYKHFRETASVFNAFASTKKVEHAKTLIDEYR